MLPAHAFDYLEMKEKAAMSTDLLTKERQSMLVKRDGAVRMTIAACGGRVWKLKC